MMKRYLGDGVYADYDGYAIILTTENGIAVTNAIVLEPQVLEGLNQYVQMLNDLKRQSLGSAMLGSAEVTHMNLSDAPDYEPKND